MRVDSLRHDPDMIWQAIPAAPVTGMSRLILLAAVFGPSGMTLQWLKNGCSCVVMANATPTPLVMPRDIPLLTMAQRKSARYFIERSNQDVKTELGWDDFRPSSCRPGNTT